MPGGGGDPGFCLDGGGGGGASGVQTCSTTASGCTLTATAGDPQLVVAGGGGGGGGGDTGSGAGGAGGDAGKANLTGAGDGGTSTCQGGGGGASNNESAGGGGGAGSSFGPAGSSVSSATSVSVTPSVAISWTLTPATPTVSIATPAAGATFANGQVVDTSFSCSQPSPGLGVSSCTDQDGRPSGAAVDTSHAGTYTLTVTARSPDGLQHAASVTYTVLPPAPVGSTGQAWRITQTVALLDGTVDPEGAVVSSCRFEYGTSSAYGSTAPCAFSPGEGSAPVAVSAALADLRSGTQYHYRLVVPGPGGTTNGSDGVFTTATAPCLARVGHVRISGAAVSVPLTASGSSGTRCTVRATLRALRRRHAAGLIASKTATVSAGSKRTIRLSLNRAGRKLLRSSRWLKVSLGVRQKSPSRRGALAIKTLTLR